MVEELSERAALVHARRVEPNIDNMLKIVRYKAQKCIPSAGGHYWKKIMGTSSLPCVETQWGQSHTGKADTTLTVRGIGSASSVFYG
jgi:hypothetical protein